MFHRKKPHRMRDDAVFTIENAGFMQRYVMVLTLLNVWLSHSAGQTKYMTRTIALTTSLALVLVSGVGCFIHEILGLHLGWPHNLYYLGAGVVGWYFGSLSTPAARSFCRTYGTAWLLLAATVAASSAAPNLRQLVNGQLSIGKVDGLAFAVVGILFLVAGHHRSRIVPWTQRTKSGVLSTANKSPESAERFAFLD